MVSAWRRAGAGGERLEDGIRREVREETGLEVEPEEIVAVFDHITHAEEDPTRVRFHYVLIDYRCRLIGGILAGATDVTEVRWARWKELTGHGALALRPFTLSVIRKALEQAGCAHPKESSSPLLERNETSASQTDMQNRAATAGTHAATQEDPAP